MERLVDPAVADLQSEYAQARRAGAVWRARWTRVVGYLALGKAFASHAGWKIVRRRSHRTVVGTADTGGSRDFGAIVLVAIVAFFVVVGFVVPSELTVLVLVGGLAVGMALLLITRWRGPYTASEAGPVTDPGAGWPPTDIINASHIRVAGVGGLGLVGVALAMALEFPAIGSLLVLALTAGCTVGVALVLYRHRIGSHRTIRAGEGPLGLK